MRSSSKRTRILLWSGLVALVGFGIFGALRPRSVVVEVVSPTRGSVRVTVEEEGKTRIRDRYVISAPTAGQLQRIELDPGDPCVAGVTVLASMTPAPPSLLDVRTRAAAVASVGSAEAAREVALAEVERATAQREFARLELGRARELSQRQPSPMTPAELDRAVLDDERARVDLRSREFALRLADFELERARAQLDAHGIGDVDGPIDRVELRAPASGKVLRRFRDSEGFVFAGEPLLEIGDPLSLEIVVDLLSSDAVRVEPDATVEVTHWGGAEVLKGRVRRIEPSGFTKVSALGVEEQRVNVLVDPGPSEAWRRLGDGYRVELRIVLAETQDVLRLPASCLFRWQGGSAAFLVNGGRAALTPLTIGLRGSNEVEVRGGVSPDSEVIVYPSDRLSHGARVHVLGR